MTLKLFALTLLGLTLALLLAGPAGARTTQDGDGDMVTKTFQLTVNGDVPDEGEFLYVRYSPRTTDPSDTGFVLFCGQLFEIDQQPACQGNGTVYTGSISFPAGTTVEFSFERSNQATSTGLADPYEIDVFQRGSETLSADLTNRATFTYGENTLPGTGVRDMASRAFAAVATAVVLLTTGVYLRRRIA
jgi:hypothetical protein